MKAEIESFGYKMWKEENEKSFRSRLYQKRVDTLLGWEGVPLCQCNDRLVIYLEEATLMHGGDNHKVFTIKIKAKVEDKIWCDLGFYSFTEDKLSAIPFMEKKLKAMWIEFNKGD